MSIKQVFLFLLIFILGGAMGYVVSGFVRDYTLSIEQREALAYVDGIVGVDVHLCKGYEPAKDVRSCAYTAVFNEAYKTENPSICAQLDDAILAHNCRQQVERIQLLENKEQFCGEQAATSVVCLDLAQTYLAAVKADIGVCEGVADPRLRDACRGIVNPNIDLIEEALVNEEDSLFAPICDELSSPICEEQKLLFLAAVSENNKDLCDSLEGQVFACNSERVLYAAYSQDDASICQQAPTNPLLSPAQANEQCLADLELAKILENPGIEACDLLEDEGLAEFCRSIRAESDEARFDYLGL